MTPEDTALSLILKWRGGAGPWAPNTPLHDDEELELLDIAAAIREAVGAKEAEYAKVRKDQGHREKMLDSEIAEAVGVAEGAMPKHLLEAMRIENELCAKELEAMKEAFHPDGASRRLLDGGAKRIRARRMP